MTQSMSLWNRFRAQPVHMLCWAGLIVVLAWAVVRSFPTGFDPSATTTSAQGSDFIYYFKGAEGIHNGTDPYARWDFGHRINCSYNYPPLFATLLSVLVPLGVLGAAQVWFVVNVCLVVLIFFWSYWLVSARFGLPRDQLSVSSVLLLSAGIGIEVLRREVSNLQTDTIMLISILGMVTTMDRRSRALGVPGALLWPALAGLSLAVGIHVKFLLLVFLPYLVVSRRLATFAWCMVWVGGIFLGTAAVSGWDDNLRHYATSLGGASKLVSNEGDTDAVARVHDMTWTHSVSIPSMFARALSGGSTQHLHDEPPEYSKPLVLGLTGLVAGACVLLAWWIYRVNGLALFAQFWDRAARPPPEEQRRLALIEVCMVIVVQLAFSPQTMKRHMFLAFLPVILCSALALLPRRRGGLVFAAGALLILLAGMTLPPGGEATEHLVRLWKWYSGVTWCLLAFAFMLMWASLRTHRAIVGGTPVTDPPPRRVAWFRKGTDHSG